MCIYTSWATTVPGSPNSVEPVLSAAFMGQKQSELHMTHPGMDSSLSAPPGLNGFQKAQKPFASKKYLALAWKNGEKWDFGNFGSEKRGQTGGNMGKQAERG